MTECDGGCGGIATQKVVSMTETLRVCGYCAVSLVQSGFKISADNPRKDLAVLLSRLDLPGQ